MSGRDLVLAVDGGGAKTDLALLDADGELLAHVRGGSSQAHHLGVDGCVAVLDGLLQAAAAQAGLAVGSGPLVARAELLLAGADVPQEISALQTAIELRGWSERLAVGNDTEALLRAGTDRGWGVAVVCGTGINCLGRRVDGREARFLSFGAVSGDWGGGTDVGVAALAAAVRSADGRGPRSALEHRVPAHFSLTDPLALAEAVHLGKMSAGRLGELVGVVLAAIEEDPVAAAIIDRLAAEVIAFARAALERLWLGAEDPDLILGGRLLRMMPAPMIETIETGIREVCPAARVMVSASEPIVGAALLGLDALAADRGGPGPSPDTYARARAALDGALATPA